MSEKVWFFFKRASRTDLSFRELKIYYSENGFHVEDSSIEANFNLRNKDGEYNLLAELLADKNNIPFIFVKFSDIDKAAISERNDYGYGCILSVYEKIKAVLRMLIEDSDRTANVIAAEIGVTKRTIERTFVSLQKKGKIERIGSKRDGMWVVIQ